MPQTSSSKPPFLALFKDNLRRDPYSAYITLATVEHHRGTVVPRARTVVFEGFVNTGDNDDGDVGIAIKCSSESNKHKSRASDDVEIVHWFERTRTQFRFRGAMTFDVDEDSATRVKIWRELSMGDRAQFFYPSDTLATSIRDDAFERQGTAFGASQGAVAANFCVGVLTPLEVDVLDLNTCERTLWSRDSLSDKWTEVKGFAPPVVSVDAIQRA